MKSILFTTLFLCSAITAMANTYKYSFGGLEYEITYDASSFVTSIDPMPTVESFTFPEYDFSGLYQGVMITSTSKHVVLASSMTELKGNNFQNNISLISITGASIETIKNDFIGCTSLTTVDMPNMKAIGASAFNGCSALTSISFPNAESIGASAFRGCVALTSINLGCIPSNINAFADCNFATSKPAITVKCENTEANKTTLTTIFGVSTWAYDSEKGVMYANYSEPVTPPATYTITIDNAIANGSVEVEESAVAAGNVVTINVTPNSGYTLVEVSVVDEANNEIEVTNNQFTMPASNVTISAIFSRNTVTPVCGVEASAEAGIAVAGTNIIATGDGVLTVYNILGKQVLSTQVSGSETVSLTKGVYIVKFADKTTKIVLK